VIYLQASLGYMCHISWLEKLVCRW